MTTLPAAFRSCWQQLEPLGRATATGGYRRFAWSDADLSCREWFCAEAARRELDVERDRNGNLWAWWDVGAERRDAVVTGSHLDSVPDGGAFDGPLGVVSGLLAVDLLRARRVQPTRPLAVACFADEEGARFGVACVGSRLLTGTLSPATAVELRDREGVSLGSALRTAGVDDRKLGRDQPLLDSIGVFVELHIEQGRRLVHQGKALGAATSIWPHGRWRFDFAGEANHAGTTLNEDRRDPVMPLAAMVLEARRAAAAMGGVATVGRVDIEPNAVNAVAGTARAWLDARAPDDTAVADLVAQAAASARRAGAEHGVSVTVHEESRTAAVEFPRELRTRLGTSLARRGISCSDLPTGAGHDAGVLAGEVPSAMLFVRNPTGVSHSPRESAAEADCVAGIEALAAVLEDLACR